MFILVQLKQQSFYQGLFVNTAKWILQEAAPELSRGQTDRQSLYFQLEQQNSHWPSSR